MALDESSTTADGTAVGLRSSHGSRSRLLGGVRLTQHLNELIATQITMYGRLSTAAYHMYICRHEISCENRIVQISTGKNMYQVPDSPVTETPPGKHGLLQIVQMM